MLQKKATALSFLSIPHKTSNGVYEVLAKEAAESYLRGGTFPNKYIAKQAKARGFNHDQIHRVVELTNHRINADLSKESKDQLFTFPTATVSGVIEEMGSTGGVSDEELRKSAESEIDWGMYDRLHQIPDYVDVVAGRRFNRSLSGSIEPVNRSVGRTWKDMPKTAQDNYLIERRRRAEADSEYATLSLRESLSRLRSEWDKLHDSRDDRVEFLKAASCVLGFEYAGRLAKSYGADDLMKEISSEELVKIAEYIDEGHPLVSLLKDVRERTKVALEKRASLFTLAGNLLGYGVRAAKATGKAFGRGGKVLSSYKPLKPLGNIVRDPLNTFGGKVLFSGAKDYFMQNVFSPLTGVRPSKSQAIKSGFLQTTGVGNIPRLNKSYSRELS